jgi:hypothetical protein
MREAIMCVRKLLPVLGSVFLFACGSGGSGGSSGGGGGGETIPTTNAEHNQMLATLGFRTELGPRADPAGTAVAEAWHPLGSEFTTFRPQAELYVAGLVVGGASEHLFDDLSNDYAPISFTTKADPSWIGSYPKGGVAGDLDGDGLSEIFIAYWVDVGGGKLRYIVYDVGSTAVKEGEIDASVPRTNLSSWNQPSLAAGDLDGDGRDEVAVGFARLHVVDGLEGEPTVKRLQHAGQDAQRPAFVAIGNTDWDAGAELVVTYTVGDAATGKYAIYDGNLAAPVQEGALTLIDPGGVTRTTNETVIGIGDVDGDRMGEIVFGGRKADSWASMYILEYESPTTQPLYGWKRVFYDVPAGASVWNPGPLRLLDFDGDGRKEVLFGSWIFRLDEQSRFVNAVPEWGDPNEFFNPWSINMGFGASPIVGDMDGDGRDDMIYGGFNVVKVRGLDSLGRWADGKHVFQSDASTQAQPGILVAANVDRDSAVVRYDGEHELLFAKPQVIAVLASPPYREGIDQNVAMTRSTFGQRTGETVDEARSLGFKVGASVGYDGTVPIFGGPTATVSMKEAFDFVATTSSTIEKYHAYATGPREDKVVFTTVAFDVFYYTIVSAPDSPEAVGRQITINLPREPQTLASTVEFYNAHNGGGTDVDERVFRHRKGDVASYPTVAERDRLLDAAEARERGYERLWNGPMTVGEGGGFSQIGISSTEGSANATAMDFSVDAEFVCKFPGGVKIGTSVGFHFGHTVTFTTKDTASFEGQVGDIPAASYTAQNMYRYGLFVYPEQVDDQKFLVMNYWTER